MTLKMCKFVSRGKILCPVIHAALDIDTSTVYAIIVVNEQDRTDRVVMTQREFDNLPELEIEIHENSINSSI